MVFAFGLKRRIAQGKTPLTNEEIENMEYQKPEFSEYVRDFMKRTSTRCKRCKGFMARDGESSVVCRCVQCGDVVDPTILKNRRAIVLPVRRRRYTRAN
jgi:tRNA(Ile2) C34 agmatinyltransferase TiaS